MAKHGRNKNKNNNSSVSRGNGVSHITPIEKSNTSCENPKKNTFVKDNQENKDNSKDTNITNLAKKSSEKKGFFKDFFSPERKAQREQRAKEKEEKYNRLPWWRKLIRKALFVIGGVVGSIILGLAICFVLNYNALTVQMLKSNYGSAVASANRIICKSKVDLYGEINGEKYSETYTLDMRLADNFFCSIESNTSDYAGLDFGEMYVWGNYCYVKKTGTNEWVKFNFKEFFGQNSEPYMMFSAYYNVNLFDNYELTKDANYYYINQQLPLSTFLKFMGGDTINPEVYETILQASAESSSTMYVNNTYKFNRSDYSLVSVSFSFSEPLTYKGNSISININMDYSTGTDLDFVVPTNIYDSATEISVDSIKPPETTTSTSTPIPSETTKSTEATTEN